MLSQADCQNWEKKYLISITIFTHRHHTQILIFNSNRFILLNLNLHLRYVIVMNFFFCYLPQCSFSLFMLIWNAYIRQKCVVCTLNFIYEKRERVSLESAFISILWELCVCAKRIKNILWLLLHHKILMAHCLLIQSSRNNFYWIFLRTQPQQHEAVCYHHLTLLSVFVLETSSLFHNIKIPSRSTLNKLRKNKEFKFQYIFFPLSISSLLSWLKCCCNTLFVIHNNSLSMT